MLKNEIGLDYKVLTGHEPTDITELHQSGSNRLYFRVTGAHPSVVAAYNEDIRENRAFFYLTRHFQHLGFPVPELLYVSPSEKTYLLSDLGDTTLFSLLMRDKDAGRGISGQVSGLYEMVVRRLADFQVRGSKNLDFRHCYPREAFDEQSIRWDLNYFKYYFLKLSGISFDEQALEDDFLSLKNELLKTDLQYFMYRDFQSRNIMIVDDEPWFIDYQGGRRGGLQYDIASLLYDAKAELNPGFRAHLLEIYLDRIESTTGVLRTSFMKSYPLFILIRILQALGAYGYRGYFERKALFLQSIPFALVNLEGILGSVVEVINLPHLSDIFNRMLDPDSVFRQKLIQLSNQKNILKVNKNSELDLLKIRICSFSYKRSQPEDPSGNGGGFVFDCRALPNPGRLPEFRDKTGRDPEVVGFLEREPAVGEFISQVKAIVTASIRNYQERGFSNLMISFGCTGGQHRSVYCAEQLAHVLQSESNVSIELHHIEQELK